MSIDRALPAQIFLDGEGIAAAGFLEAQESTANRSYDLSLATYNPSARSRRGEVGNGKWTAIGPDDVTHARMQLTVHLQPAETQLTRVKLRRMRLKNS
jgi:hypothetical protein